MSESSWLPGGLPEDPTEHTAARLARPVPDFDPADFERAERGLLAQIDGPITGAYGVAWDTAKYDFIREADAAPDTVDPSLWRQARLNAVHGLFEVAPKIWQARGYDISNITFIEGDTGWVVIDPLTSTATAAACLDLANATLGERPVTAVIYTHSHLDHFGGVLGVTTQADVDEGRCVIVAPEHFLAEVVAENLLAGFAMTRRANYQFGPLIPPGPRGHVDCGLGKAVPIDVSAVIVPTIDITETGQTLTLDGVRVEFQLTPETEAPAEMNFFFPDHGWLCMAENCSHNLHNLIPIRGAQARDAKAWARYIDDAIEMFGDRTEIMFASHHWPRWGNDDVVAFLRRQRDLYQFIHDETLRLANHGYVATEIAEMVELPAELVDHSHTVGYYGSLVHNVKAVYQRYLSWYDGNPAHLHQHPPVEAGRRYVELAGGADALLAHARGAFDDGDYRWVAEVVNRLVFADPSNVAARSLQAAALEQLGYQSESATFRNAYLFGAQELRHGPPPRRPAQRNSLVRALPIDHQLDLAGVRFHPERFTGDPVVVMLVVNEVRTPGESVTTTEDWLVEVSNRTIHARRDQRHPRPDATLTLTHDTLTALLDGTVELDEAELGLDGDLDAVARLLAALDTFESGFPIVER